MSPPEDRRRPATRLNPAFDPQQKTPEPTNMVDMQAMLHSMHQQLLQQQQGIPNLKPKADITKWVGVALSVLTVVGGIIYNAGKTSTQPELVQTLSAGQTAMKIEVTQLSGKFDALKDQVEEQKKNSKEANAETLRQLNLVLRKLRITDR